MESEEIIVLYHANCPDGFGSAWSFWKKYGSKAKYIPVKHGEPPPDVSGHDVFIADFSYDRETLLSMERDSKSIVVLDHHITAKKDLEGLDFCHFDMNHSGAYLSWAYNFGEESVAPLILYIEDRDLWKWELPNSEQILSAIDSYDRDFDTWDKLNGMLELDHSSTNVSWGFDRLKAEGGAILRYKNNLLESLSNNKYDISILGNSVPVINSPFFQSELGSSLAKDSKFSAVYYYNGEGYIFSLRSSDHGEDVSEIAKVFGGGGHRNASGFSISSPDKLNPKENKDE